MNRNFNSRGRIPTSRSLGTPTTPIVAWCVMAALVGAGLLAAPDDRASLAAGGPVAIQAMTDVRRADPVRAESGITVVSDEIADRKSVEASVAAYQ